MSCGNPDRRKWSHDRTRSMLGAVRRRPALFFHVLLCWVWLNLCLQGPFGFSPLVLYPGWLLPSWTGPILFCAITYFLMAVFLKRTTLIVRRRWYLPVIAVCMTLGATSFLCIYQIPGLPGNVETLLYLIGSLLLGCSTACMLIELSRLFGCFGARYVLFNGIAAMACSAIIVFAVESMGSMATCIMFVCIPVPLVSLQARSMREFSKKTLYERGTQGQQSMPYRFMVTAIAMGLARGVIVVPLFGLGASQGIVLSLIAMLMASAVAFVGAALVKLDFNHLIYHVGFPMMAFGALILSISLAGIQVGIVFQLSGFYFTYFIIWGLCAYLIKYFDQSPIWVVGYPTAFLMFGQFIGGVAGYGLTITGGSVFGIGEGELLATLMAFVLFMVAIFVLGDLGFSKGWGSAQPACKMHPDDILETACHKVVVIYGLTSREYDVFKILATGCGRRSIREELVISDNTAKAHIRSIYRKLEIHSHQELLDIVDHYAQESGQVLQNSGYSGVSKKPPIL